MPPFVRAFAQIVLGESIRGRLWRVLILSSLLPLIGLTAYVGAAQRDDLTDVADDNLRNQAQLQAVAIEMVLRHADEDVSVLAANPLLAAPFADRATILAQLEAYTTFEEVTLLHPMGAAVASTYYGFASDWTANAAFREALQGRNVMSPPLYYTDPDRLVVEFAAPVMADGEVSAVVVGSLNMERVWRVLDAARVGETGFFAAFDRNGNVIAHPDRDLILRRPDGYSGRVSTADGRSVSLQTPDGAYVGHEVAVGSSGWRVAALQSENETYALANTTTAHAFGVALILAWLALAAATFLGRTISRPLQRLGWAMRRISDGDLGHRVEPTGFAEIDLLTDSFNGMAQRLEVRNAALDEEMKERDRAEQSARYQAYHDPLTGLPNRMLLADRLRLALADSRRSGQPLAVVFIDLDRFKLVNDTLGHSHGDDLLQRASDRILSLIREGDSLARVGGDEYVLLLPRVSSSGDATEVAERILASLRQPWLLAGREYGITASLGIAMYPGDGDDAETLLRNADMAMYAAKDDGRDSIRLFTANMDASIQERAGLEQALRQALSNHEFELHYQPQFETRSGRAVGIEALLRWRSPGRGFMSAAGFIGVAEETGIIWEIGRWVLDTACRQAKSWLDEGALDGIPVAVNVSARQFQDVSIVDLVRDALEASGLPANQLELEITESTAMRDVDHSVLVLSALKDLGVRVSIDDFGTGYSSLSYLKRFPIDAVKIDRSFVSDLASDSDDAAIVEAILAVATSLQIGTVAEGVETEEQLIHLRMVGCEAVQGFLLSDPLPPARAGELLSRGRYEKPSLGSSHPAKATSKPAFGT